MASGLVGMIDLERGDHVVAPAPACVDREEQVERVLAEAGAAVSARYRPGHRHLAVAADGPWRLVVWGRLFALTGAFDSASGPVDPQQAAEAVLRAWIGSGSDWMELLRRLRGEFALVILNEQADRAWLVADRAAYRPLFWRQQPNGAAMFASDVATLADAAPGGRAIDPTPFARYMASGHLLGCETWLGDAAGVHLLGPGQVLAITPQRCEIRSYWTFIFDTLRQLGDRDSPSRAQAMDELHQRCLTAVRRRIAGVGRVGCLLSGGMDSRAIAGALHELGAPATAVTWGHQADATSFSDIGVAGRVARRLAMTHAVYDVQPSGLPDCFDHAAMLLDGQAGDAGNYPDGGEVLRTLGGEFDVILRGDECFGWKRAADNLFDAVRVTGAGFAQESAALMSLVTPQGQAHAAQADEPILRMIREAGDQPPDDFKDAFYYHHRLARRLAGLNTLKLHYVESSNPWLDEDVIDWVLQLPAAWRTDKQLFTEMARDRWALAFRDPLAMRGDMPRWEHLIGRERWLQDWLRQRLHDSEVVAFAESMGLDAQRLAKPFDAPKTNGLLSKASLRRRLGRFSIVRKLANHLRQSGARGPIATPPQIQPKATEPLWATTLVEPALRLLAAQSWHAKKVG